MKTIYIAYGYEGGESFARTFCNEYEAKSFVRNFYFYKISNEPTERNFVRITIAKEMEAMNAKDALAWANKSSDDED